MSVGTFYFLLLRLDLSTLVEASFASGMVIAYEVKVETPKGYYLDPYDTMEEGEGSYLFGGGGLIVKKLWRNKKAPAA